MRSIYFILLFLFQLSAIIGQSKVVIEDNEISGITINDQAIFYCDSTNTSTIDQIVKLPQSAYTSISKKGLNPPANSYNYWVKFTLVSPTDKEVFILVKSPNNDKLKFYTTNSNNSINSSLDYGDLTKTFQRDFSYENPIYEIKLEKNIPQNIYIEFWTYTIASRIPIEVHTYKTLIDEISYQHLKLGILFGFIFIFVIVSIYNITFSIRRMQLYLLLVIFGTSFYILIQSGIGMYYLWSSISYYNSIMMDISALIVFVSVILMLKEYLCLSKTAPKSNILLSIIAIIFPILVLIVTVGFYTIPENIFQPFNDFIGIFYLSVNILIFYVIIMSYFKDRKKKTLYFLVANFIYFIAVCIYNLVPFLSIPDIIYDNAYWLIIIYIINLIFLFSYNQTEAKELYLAAQYELIEQKDQAVKNVVLGQLNERKRLSRELHDGVSTMLANIKMRLSSLTINKEQEYQKESIQKDLNELSIDIRKYAHNLNPTVLVERGIIKAINETIYKFEMANCDIDYTFESNIINDQNINIAIQHAIYFCHIEILNNIVKHGENVSTINLVMTQHDQSISLKICDNGEGLFDIKHDHSGLGIENIQNRIKSLNGQFNIYHSDKNLCHQIIIPL